jgi:hypothetical protein
MGEEILFEYAGHTEQERLDNRGILKTRYSVKLKSVKRTADDDSFALTVSSESKQLFEKYPRDCTVPVQLNKTSQKTLGGK